MKMILEIAATQNAILEDRLLLVNLVGSKIPDENFAMTASHPASSDEEGQPGKDLWPPPEGSAAKYQMKGIPW